MIVVFTGNGKGKTTAALGQAVRALGRGRRVLMIQFIKGPWRSGEDEFVEKMKVHKANIKDKDQTLLEGLENIYDFDIKKMGLGFVGILGDRLPKEDHQRAAEHALAHFKREFGKLPAEGGPHVIILDEVNVAVSLGLIKKEDVISALQGIPEERIVILTGRDAPKEFIEAADLVTEMREVKHPFLKGEKAKISVEF